MYRTFFAFLKCAIQVGPKVDVLLIAFLHLWLKFCEVLTNTGSFRQENYSTFITMEHRLQMGGPGTTGPPAGDGPGCWLRGVGEGRPTGTFFRARQLQRGLRQKNRPVTTLRHQGGEEFSERGTIFLPMDNSFETGLA